MTISRKLSAFAAALALLVGFTLSACGEDEQRDSTSGSSSDEGLTEETFFATLIDEQVKARTTHMVMTMGVGAQTIKADADVELDKSFADSSMSMSMDMGSAGPTTMKLLLVNGTLYMNFGQVTDGKYVRMDLDDENNAFGKQFTQFMNQMDPRKQVEQFRHAVTSLEKRGDPEQLDGVDAQPYEVVLDTSKIDAFQDLPGGAAASVPDTLTYVMYMGPDNLPRRITFEVAGTSTQIDYSKWGRPVDIKAPDPSEVSDKDLSELMGAMPTPSV